MKLKLAVAFAVLGVAFVAAPAPTFAQLNDRIAEAQKKAEQQRKAEQKAKAKKQREARDKKNVDWTDKVRGGRSE
jgi:hypothetical protein